MAVYRITGLRLELKETWADLPSKIEKACGFDSGSVQDEQIIIRRMSLDARKKQDLHYVVTADFGYSGKLTGKARKKLVIAPDLSLPEIIRGTEPLSGSPVVIGSGPCGLFAALRLAEAGYRPLIIERGKPMDQRIADVTDFWVKKKLNTESNVLFGEGGAGTFSDGKLTTGIKDPRIHWVLETFVQAGAPEDILWQQKPHIGTDLLRKVVVNLRHRIEKAGGTFFFNTCMADLIIEGETLSGVVVQGEEGLMTITTNALICASGHSARDTFRMLKKHHIPMEPKPFSIGVRMIHPQSLIDQAQYGEAKGLPPATYKLSCHTSGGRGVYSFCMCPGGEVVTCSTEEGMLCVNGMSNRNRDSGWANAGILVDVRVSDFPSDDVLAGVAFQEIWEKQAFLAGGKSFMPPSCTWAEFRDQMPEAEPVMTALPDFASEALAEAIPIFGKKLKGFDDDTSRIIAVETRSSSPVRMLRDASGQSSVKGFYPAGEGAGYAGGIMSAACDGSRAAEALICRFCVPQLTDEVFK